MFFSIFFPSFEKGPYDKKVMKHFLLYR